jgi:Ni/Co efflux regulator RcnB
MNKILSGATGALVAAACVFSATSSAAQDRWHDNGRPDRQDSHDNRGKHHWNYYGGRYGYAGYHGRWREGQRYPYWNNSRYYVTDYRAYDLPPPRAGYRYYRDDSGDIVMAAIGSGIIGMILGSQLSHR